MRLYAGYNLDNGKMFELTIWTYGVSCWYWMSEIGLYKTKKLWTVSTWVSLAIDGGVLMWILAQWDSYLSHG